MSRDARPALKGDDAEPFTLTVALAPGVADVTVDRRDVALGSRGGFEAAWVTTDATVVSLEAFRTRVLRHLGALYRAGGGAAAPTAMLNLASHQLLDDLRGWARLNEDALRPIP